jgi:hypothetical protein
MNPSHRHSPLKPVSNRVRCPVCHEEVYSRAGIHPQCAVRQVEPPRPKGKATVALVQAGQKAIDQPAAAVVVDQETLKRISDSDRPSV